jgi:5-formyltetrahydrofolate cyclo-ligase
LSSPGNKADLRARMLARRAEVSEPVRRAFAERLATLGPGLVRDERRPVFDPVVSLYWPIKGEADPMRLTDVLARSGLVTALPVTGDRGRPLRFQAWRPGDPHVPGPWNIGQPGPDAPAVEPDVLFLPLAAFDRRGARLGYGAGYYDATLEDLRRRKPVRAIGVGFACQEVLFLPAEAHDQPLDMVVTERELILCDA